MPEFKVESTRLLDRVRLLAIHGIDWQMFLDIDLLLRLDKASCWPGLVCGSLGNVVTLGGLREVEGLSCIQKGVRNRGCTRILFTALL